MESSARHLDLPYTLAMLDDKQGKTEQTVYGIINTPPPAPKKEETKEESKQEDAPAEGEAAAAPEEKPAEADTEMKDEATI